MTTAGTVCQKPDFRWECALELEGSSRTPILENLKTEDTTLANYDRNLKLSFLNFRRETISMLVVRMWQEVRAV